MMQVLVLGAGQLARMMALAGAPLNITVSAYDVRSHTTVHPVTWQNLNQDLQAAIDVADVVSAEFEHIPTDILEVAEASGKFLPGAKAILAGGDRRIEKKLLDSVAVPNAKHHVVLTQSDLETACEVIGLPLVLKSALDGYDGKGQWRIKSLDDVSASWPEIQTFLNNSQSHQAMVAEEWIGFDREVSIIGARTQDGSVAVYPLTENHHHNGVLSVSLAPAAEGDMQAQAIEAFARIANALDYVGVLAIELFDVQGKLLVNEIAPRVHNSGHWTQQGAQYCQFENHLRAICDLPLGATDLIQPTAMVNILGQDSLPAEVYAMADVHIHWYAKEKRPGRKVGHINVRAESNALLIEKLTKLQQVLPEEDYPGLSEFLEK